MENPWKIEWEIHGKSKENSMENPWEIHGQSMDNKNGKKEMFPWYSMGSPWVQFFGSSSLDPAGTK